MGGESPVVNLFSSDGYEMAVDNAIAIPANTRAYLVAGTDGTNARIILMDGSSRQIVAGAGTAGTPAGGVLSIQGVSGGTAVAEINAQTSESSAAWTSATSVNAVLALTVTGYGTVVITLNQGTTITAGAVIFEVSDSVAGTNWYPISTINTFASAPSSTYTLVAGVNVAFQLNVAGLIQFRVRLSTAIVGTGTVNIGIAASAASVTTAQEQFSLLTDGTNGPAAVKPGSTLPLFTDPALVVTLSPNSNSAVDIIGVNRLDLIYSRIDDLFNLMIGEGINTNEKTRVPRSFLTTQQAFAASTTATIYFNTNNARIGGTVANDIGSTSNLYLLLGASPSNKISATNYTILLVPNGYYEIPFGFSGRIDGLWSAAVGNAYVTEIVGSNVW